MKIVAVFFAGVVIGWYNGWWDAEEFYCPSVSPRRAER